MQKALLPQVCNEFLAHSSLIFIDLGSLGAPNGPTCDSLAVPCFSSSQTVTLTR